MIPPKIQHIVDWIDITDSGSVSFMNKHKEEYISVRIKILESINLGNRKDLPDYEPEVIEELTSVSKGEERKNFALLPRKEDFDEHSIMKEFADHIGIPDALYELEIALEESDPQKKFNKILKKYDLVDEYRNYRYYMLRPVITAWCRKNHIPYI